MPRTPWEQPQRTWLFLGSLSLMKTSKKKVQRFASKQGFIDVHDKSGCNVHAQIIDTDKIKLKKLAFTKGTVLLVFDYAFGEQAYELMDELLKTKTGKHIYIKKR